MANFSTANLVKAQARLAQKYTEAELRTKQSPALQVASKNTSILIPSHEQLRTREDRTVEAPILARSKRSTTSSRTYNHAGSRGDSIVLSLSWASFVDKFTMSLKMLDNNVFAFEEVLAQQILNAALNIHEDIETAGIAYLKANKTQVNAATKGGAFSAINHVFEVAAADKARYWQLAKSMMRQNNYRGTFDVISGSGVYVDGEYYANQGGGNSANTNFQFSGLNIFESTELADSNYANGVSMFIPEGQFAVLPWIPKQNRVGRGDYNSYNGGFGSIADPTGSGLQLALHAYSQRADTSASNGNTQDEVMEFELSVDLAWVSSPLSVATETVIYEVAQL